MAKKGLKTLLILVLIIALAVVGYCIYVIGSYHRIADNQPLAVNQPSELKPASTGTEYKITCYNIGFGAYLPDYTFFMDGGSESRAESEESVLYATQGAAETILSEAPDFAIFEEVDTDSDRSWHVNQREALEASFAGCASTFAVNYDSAYLFYPILKPIGKSKSGISFFSGFAMYEDAVRRSLPIDTGFAKFFDLDRCYSVNRVYVDNGKSLVIYAVHLSAYSSNPEVRNGQLEMLFEDMAAEYAKGNYVIAGGDFNHDLKAEGDTELTFDWAHCIDRSTLPAGIRFAFDHLSQEAQDAFVDTTRNTDIPYTPGESYTVTIDGFLLSDNIEMLTTETIDTQFAYSDHNPVKMTFKLLDE